MKLFSFAASLAILASEAFAMFEEAENLDEASWEDKVINSDEAWMITFYTEWCPYCTKFSDEIKVAKQDNELEGKMVRFGAVNAMTNRGLSKKYNVKRAPTIKVFGQDKSSPVDYLGHRKAGDVVSFLSDYATEQGFIVAPKVEEKEEAPAAEELYTYSQEEPIVLGDSAPQAEEEKPAKAEYVPTKATYFYNVDAIVKDVVLAHDTRVRTANAEHEKNVTSISSKYPADLQAIKDDYATQLQDLTKERHTALTELHADQAKIVDDVKTDFAQEIDQLDQEAIDTIEAIIAQGKADYELSDFIGSLNKEWFNIEWSNSNRRAKGASAPAAKVTAAPAPVAQQPTAVKTKQAAPTRQQQQQPQQVQPARQGYGYQPQQQPRQQQAYRAPANYGGYQGAPQQAQAGGYRQQPQRVQPRVAQQPQGYRAPANYGGYNGYY